MSVFHLKYRPQKLGDLDSAQVGRILKKILENKERPQCFLFTGPKGSGKTSAARIMTRAINCLSPDGIEPCGECDNCREISSGSSLDVMEIDAASNRGIEDIRLLKEKAYLLPSKLLNKVFIIDEVHMLTKEAFNALLKLIEEPPKNTIFVLCTTDAQKIPETVLSRLIRVDFNKGNFKELKGSLGRIIDAEKIKIDEEALDLIVARSDGSYRNLHKTFNEINLEYGKKISKKEVEEYLGQRAGDYRAEDFEKDLLASETKTILSKMEKMAEIGVDFTVFREKLLDFFQKKMLAFYGVGQEEESGLSPKEIGRWLNLLIMAGKNEKDMSISQLPLELAVVEFLANSNLENGGGRREEEEMNTQEVGVKVKKSDEEEKVKGKNKEKNEEEVADAVSEDLGEAEIDQVEQEGGGSDVPMEEIEKGWGNLLLAVKPFNHSVEAFLRATRPKTVSNRVLVVEVFYPFHKDRLEENRNRRIVEEGIKKIYGVDLGFECVLASSKGKALVINNDTPVTEVSATLAEEDEVKTESKDIYDVAKDIFG